MCFSKSFSDPAFHVSHGIRAAETTLRAAAFMAL